MSSCVTSVSYTHLDVYKRQPFSLIVILGTDNGVNFCDGLDGLCSSVTLLVAVFFTVVSIGEKGGIEPVTAAVAGALMGLSLIHI